MVEVWRRGSGITRLALSSPPPPTAPRGGIDAAQVTPKGEIQGDDRGKGDAQQGKCLPLVEVANTADGRGPVSSGFPPARRTGHCRVENGLLTDSRGGHRMSAVVVTVHEERNRPEQR